MVVILKQREGEEKQKEADYRYPGITITETFEGEGGGLQSVDFHRAVRQVERFTFSKLEVSHEGLFRFTGQHLIRQS